MRITPSGCQETRTKWRLHRPASFQFHDTQKIMTDKTEETVEGTPLIEKDPVLVDINKKIVEAFDIFDHESNKTADVR